MRTLGLWVLLLYGIISEQTDIFCRDKCGQLSSGSISKLDKYDTTRTIELMCPKEIITTTSTTASTTTQTITDPTTTSLAATHSEINTSTSQPTTTTVEAPSTATDQLTTTRGFTTSSKTTSEIETSLATTTASLNITTTDKDITTPTTGPQSIVGSTSQPPATNSISTGETETPTTVLTTSTVTSSTPSTSSTRTPETSTQVFTDITIDQKTTDYTAAIGASTPTLPPTTHWTNKPETTTMAISGAPTNPSTTINSVTITKKSTPTSSLPTQSTPTTVTVTTMTPKPSTLLSTILSTSMKPSTTVFFPKTTIDLESSTVKTTPSTPKISLVLKSSTTATIREPTSQTRGDFTVSSKDTATPTTRVASSRSTATTVSSSQKITTSTKIATSQKSEILFTETTSTPQDKPISTTPFLSTKTGKTESGTSISSTRSTHGNLEKKSTEAPPTKLSPAPENVSSTPITRASTITEGHSTVNSEETKIPTVEDHSSKLTPTTATSSKTTARHTEVLNSPDSETPTTPVLTTQSLEISMSSMMPSSIEGITESITKIQSTGSTEKPVENSTTAIYSPTSAADNVMETKLTPEGTEGIVSKRTIEMTNTGMIVTTLEGKTTESASTVQPTTDLSTDATTSISSPASHGTDSTTETTPDTTSISTELITPKITTTEIDVSTETPSTRPPWCDYPCPYGYIEAEQGCFIMVPEEFRQNFMSAFMWCRSEDRRDLSDHNDIMTSNMIETLKYMLRLNGIRSDIIYLNGHADKLMRKAKKAGLIHLDEISMWDNLPTVYVGISTDIVNATGICRMPKYCETPVCELNAIYNTLQGLVEEVDNKTIVQGSGIRLKCRYPSRDFLKVRCIEPGELMPSPTLLACSIPADVKYEPPEKEVTGNMRVREICSDCYEDGTANCTAEGDGYVCNCKEGWNKFTCYKSIDLCPPQYCGPNGNCVTQLEDFFCNCTTGWIGDKCDVNIKKITWGGNKTIRIISSNTIASGLLGISSGIQISLKVLSKVITDKDPEDPQEAYQAFRSTCLTMGNLAIALFQHPDLLSSEPISCRWFFFFVHICYSLAFVFMLDEVLNVCTTIHGLHRNNWVHDNKMKKRWWLDIPARIQFPFVLVFALLWYVASQGWSKIPATWTCFGVFKRETSNFWYPLVLFNFVCIVLCFGFAENSRRTLSHRIQFWTANMHLVDVTNPYIRESIEKVRRNVPYCFMLPPFMFLNWLFLCWAADQQTDTVKFVSLLFSGCYTVLSMLQTLETSTGIYEYVVYYDHLYLPNCISNRILQDLTPMTWLSKNEIVARKKKTPFKGLDASSPCHPASKCYITLEHEHLMLRRMTREYLDHRVTHYSKQDEATLSVYFNELRLRHVYERNVPLEDLHLELILETWITDTKRIDQLTIPKKAKKQRETWRTRIREKNRIPPKENTNIRRMRFLKSIMDYHLKTLNPTLEYPVTGAMQRTDFRTFSPACPCVLRSQVEHLQRTWLPIIDIYIEQDWSLREVYKDVQEAEGYEPRGSRYECKKEDVEEDHWLNELRPGFIGPRSYPLVYLPALGTYLELDYYQRFADLEWARLVKHSEYLGACYDFGR